MILAGIDEAGYGPVLGPLVAALASDAVGDGDRDDVDVWAVLDGVVCRAPGASGRKLPVCDSKVLYRAAGKRGLRDLETTALAFSTWQHGSVPATAGEFVARHAEATDAPYLGFPWYGEAFRDLELPLAAERDRVLSHADRLARAAAKKGLAVHRFLIRPALEDEFNTRSESFGSKARFLFEMNVDLLTRCRRENEPLRVMCDRHGGRSRYRDLLAIAFPLEPIARVDEDAGVSRYFVGAGPGSLEIEYASGGEELSFATALASIFAKYTREIFMEALNRFFGPRVPAIRRTAGYHSDGMRYIGDLEKAGQLSAVERTRLVRRR